MHIAFKCNLKLIYKKYAQKHAHKRDEEKNMCSTLKLKPNKDKEQQTKNRGIKSHTVTLNPRGNENRQQHRNENKNSRSNFHGNEL